MLRALLLVVAVCLGCGQARLAPCSPSATGVPALPTLVTLVGEPVDVELLLPPAVFCPQGNPVATEVVTQVLDAANQPVAHTHSPPASSNTSGYSTHVSFTPGSAGVHYLTARFEPALGITQRQLQVALERSDETPWLRTTLGGVCDEVLPLREAVLCRRGTQLSVVRDGGVTSSESVAAVATAGETGWLWTDARLSRLVDVDGGFERLDYPLAITAGAIAVTSDRWLLGTGTDFVEVRFEDGGLLERRWSVEPAFGPVQGPALARAGQRVEWATPTKLCAGVPDASIACVDSPLQPLASEGPGLWLRGVESGVMGQGRVAPDGGEPVVLFIPAQSAALMDARQNRPVFSWNGRLMTVRADDLSFEAWRAPGLVSRQLVTESFVVFQLQSGQTVIYRR
jgi:hypothetical protein